MDDGITSLSLRVGSIAGITAVTWGVGLALQWEMGVGLVLGLGPRTAVALAVGGAYGLGLAWGERRALMPVVSPAGNRSGRRS